MAHKGEPSRPVANPYTLYAMRGCVEEACAGTLSLTLDGSLNRGPGALSAPIGTHVRPV